MTSYKIDIDQTSHITYTRNDGQLIMREYISKEGITLVYEMRKGIDTTSSDYDKKELVHEYANSTFEGFMRPECIRERILGWTVDDEGRIDFVNEVKANETDFIDELKQLLLDK